MTFIKSLVPSFSLLIFWLYLQPSWGYSFQGSLIYDLEGDGADFIADSAFWSVKYYEAYDSKVGKSTSPAYTICDGIYILGGPDVSKHDATFQRSYKGLPPHNIIYFSFSIWLIDEWKISHRFLIFFRNEHERKFQGIVFGQFGLLSSESFLENKCGALNINDLESLVIYGKVKHQGEVLAINVETRTEYDQTLSFGIRNVKLLFRNATEEEKDLQGELCGLAPIQIPLNECVCPEGQYKSFEGSCQLCDTNCKVCLGPSPSQCLQCADQAFFDGVDCHSPDSSGNFVHESQIECSSGYYKDIITGTCTPCKDPLCISCQSEDPAQCEKCQSGAILDSNGKCKECQFLRITYIKSLNNGHQYLLETLPSACSLNERVIEKGLTGVVEQNKSLPIFSFHVESSRWNEYLINLVFEESILEEVNIKLELYHLDGLLIIPKKIIPSMNLLKIAEYASVAELIITFITVFGLVTSILLGSTAVIWSVIGFQQFMVCLQYINVDFPLQSNLFYSLFKFSTWSFLQIPVDFIINDTSEHTIPSQIHHQSTLKFVEKNISYLFIKNGVGITLVNILCFSLFALISMVKRIQKCKNNKILKIITRNLRWNTIVRTFLETGIPLSLGIFLQIRSFSFENISLTISSIFSAAACLYLILFSLLLLRILNNNTSDELKNNESTQRYKTLWEGIILEGTFSKFYHLIIFFRGVLPLCW